MMDARLYYREMRKRGWRAEEALRAAKVREQWDAMGGHDCDANSAHRDCSECDDAQVRLRLEPDDIDLGNLFGDLYNPNANPDVQRSKLEREEKAEIERINNDGVWVVIAEYWNGTAWESADACGGFIADDYEWSGYLEDLMSEAIEAAAMEAGPDERRA